VSATFNHLRFNLLFVWLIFRFEKFKLTTSVEKQIGRRKISGERFVSSLSQQLQIEP